MIMARAQLLKRLRSHVTTVGPALRQRAAGPRGDTSRLQRLLLKLIAGWACLSFPRSSGKLVTEFASREVGGNTGHQCIGLSSDHAALLGLIGFTPRLPKSCNVMHFFVTEVHRHQFFKLTLVTKRRDPPIARMTRQANFTNLIKHA